MALANHCNLLGRAPTASSLQIGNVDGPADGISTDNAIARWNGTTGRSIQNGVVTEADFTGTLTGPTDQATTTAVGIGFTNQPANDGVEVLSADAADTTQTVTIIGTTNGTDTVVVETVTLNGTTPVATVKTDWGVVLAVKKSAVTAGTVTVREASADQTITALTAAVLSVGVTTVTNTAAYNRAVSLVGDAATTKQIGLQGTNSAGTVIYDSKALTGTTVATSNSQFLTLTEIYRGDLEAARTATVTTDGTWRLTGGGGATIDFDDVTGGITLTPSGTGKTVINNGGIGRLSIGGTPAGNNSGYLWFTDSTTQKNWEISHNAITAGMLQFTPSTAAGGSTFTTPSVSLTTAGNLLLGGLITDGTGVLQFPAATTSAGGITFGTDVNIFRSAAGSTVINGVGSVSLDIALGGTSRARLSTSATDVFFDALSGSHIFRTNGATPALTLDSSQNATFAKLITSYNGIATAGNGAVTIQAAARSDAQTAAVASVATYTLGAADASFTVSANVLVTTSTTHNFTVTCAYTDESNVARTLTLSFSNLAATFLSAITNITGAGPYEGVPLHIRCKASTAITIATAGTFTTVTYNVEGTIRKTQ